MVNAGDDVTVNGLQSEKAARLNGKIGLAKKVDDKSGRWLVVVEDKTYKLKAENLEVVGGGGGGDGGAAAAAAAAAAFSVAKSPVAKPFARCAKCKGPRYCCRDHQLLAWSTLGHKTSCKRGYGCAGRALPVPSDFGVIFTTPAQTLAVLLEYGNAVSPPPPPPTTTTTTTTTTIRRPRWRGRGRTRVPSRFDDERKGPGRGAPGSRRGVGRDRDRARPPCQAPR